MKKQSRISILFQMLKMVSPLKWWMALAITLGVLGFLCAIFIPVLGAYAVSYGLGFAIPVSLKTLFVLLILFAALRAFLHYGEQKTNHFIAFTLLAIIRDKVFQALRRLCPAKLEGRDRGDLISLITSDVELLEVFYAHTISPIVIAIVTELIMVLLIASFHPLEGLWALCSYLIIGIALPAAISKRSGSTGDELRKQNGELAAYMLENIRGLDATIQYGTGEERLAEMNRRTEEFSKKQGDLNTLTGSNTALANTLIYFCDLIMFMIGAWLYTTGKVSFDGFLIPLIALMSSYGPVSALAALGTTLQPTIASASRVLAVLEEEPETEEITGMDPVQFAGASMEHVTFGYKNEDVLKDFSADFKENRIIGVVGRSGCGKSTMLKLLMRFWSTKQGEVKISDRDINRINTADLRNMESYMTQETHLFKDTVANNIRIARLDASDEEVIEACKKASIHDFIMTLPKGYETQIGELGETLSAGERQRLSLARVFLHRAPFVLLDEPTSNMDSLNEAVILRSLKEESGDKTIILVSHRHSTVRIADETLEIL